MKTFIRAKSAWCRLPFIRPSEKIAKIALFCFPETKLFPEFVYARRHDEHK
jgi:hypothetical protein